MFLCVYSYMKKTRKGTSYISTKIINDITKKIERHHELYRFPVKVENYGKIFLTNQLMVGIQIGMVVVTTETDVVSEGRDKTRYQNKSGDVNVKKGTIKWNGHRTTSKKTIQEKIDFISEPHYDKYVMLGRNKKDWNNGIKRYYLLVFDVGFG